MNEQIINLDLPVRLVWTGNNARVIFTRAPKSVRRLLVRGIHRFRAAAYENACFVQGLDDRGEVKMMITILPGKATGAPPDGPLGDLSLWNEELTGTHHKLCERPAEWGLALEAEEADEAECDEDSDANGFITIANDGGNITETSYWNSRLAHAGMLVVSCNAGHIRVLVPTSQRAHIEDGLRGVTKLMVDALPDERWTSGAYCTHWLFEDNSPSPFVLQLSPRAFLDFHPDTSRTMPASFWVSENGECRCLATLPLEWRVVSEFEPKQFHWRHISRVSPARAG